MIQKTWKILKTVIGKSKNNNKRKITFCIADIIVTDSQVIADEFNNFFVSIGPQLASNISCTVDPLTYVNTTLNSIVVTEVSVNEVRTVILLIKNSSPGWDEIPAFVAKQCVDHYVVPLTYIINKSLVESVFPSD